MTELPSSMTEHELLRDRPLAVLEIDVNNHPGVMSHIVGLFARRGCNIEGIVCFSSAGGETSRILLLLADEKLATMSKHLANLEDVRSVRRCDERRRAFLELPELLGGF